MFNREIGVSDLCFSLSFHQIKELCHGSAYIQAGTALVLYLELPYVRQAFFKNVTLPEMKSEVPVEFVC